jgi:class 3 adenylate cyclase
MLLVVIYGVNVLILAALLVSRFVFDAVIKFSQEIACLIWGITFTALTILGVMVCPSQASSSAESYDILEDYTYLAPPILIGTSVIWSNFFLVHFGSVVWPRSFVFATISMVLQIASYFVVVSSHPTLLFAVFLLIPGHVLFMLSAAMTNRERRHDYAAMVLLERELGVLSRQKEGTDQIIRALFPKSVAERLIEMRIKGRQRSDLTVSRNLESAVVMKVITPEPIVDSFDSATAVICTIDGIEHIRPYDTQLEVLSQLFIAAEHVGEAFDAVKAKSVGTTLVFVCGIQKKDDVQHMRDACQLALDLQSMLAGFQVARSIDCLAMRIGVSTGPIVAGVIGLSRPKYDVWGYTISVAENLAIAAPAGAIFVTRDVAKAERTSFQFQMVKEAIIVAGLGKLLPFTLKTASKSHMITPNCTPAEFNLYHEKRESLADVAKVVRSRAPPKLAKFTLRFPN